MWQTGTATDYFDLLKQLREIATARHVATAAVNAGGAGYVVGDALTVAGGTNTHVATLEVTSVAAGVVTGVRITNAGAYSVDPTTVANAVTGGTGAGCTINLTMANTGWTVLRESKRALSATIAAGGTGYAVNDEIEVQGGLGIGVSTNVAAAIFVVDTVAGGVVTAVSPKSGSEGNYEEVPANPAATLPTVGTGTGCTLTVTYEVREDDHRVLVLAGAAAGSPDPVQIGFWTYEGTISALEVRNWGLFGFSASFSLLALFQDQAGRSDGLKITGNNAEMETSTTIGSTNLPLKGDDGGGTYPLAFHMSISDRRIMMAVRCNTATTDAWMTMYMGFTNQFGTTSEIPYPLLIAGSASQTLTSALDVSTVPVTTSIAHMVAGSTSGMNGPAQLVEPDGSWRPVQNGTLNASNAFSLVNEFNVVPGGKVNFPLNNVGYQPGFGIIATTQNFNWSEMIDYRVSQTPEFELYPSPDTVATKLYILVPCTMVIGVGPGNELGDRWYPFGELDGCFWFSYADGGAGANALDYMDIGTDRYRVFRTGHRAEKAVDFFAFKEA